MTQVSTFQLNKNLLNAYNLSFHRDACWLKMNMNVHCILAFPRIVYRLIKTALKTTGPVQRYWWPFKMYSFLTFYFHNNLQCGINNFKRRDECFKCGTSKDDPRTFEKPEVVQHPTNGIAALTLSQSTMMHSIHTLKSISSLIVLLPPWHTHFPDSPTTSKSVFHYYRRTDAHHYRHTDVVAH